MGTQDDAREDARDEREIVRDETYTEREEGRVDREVVRDEALIGREEVRDELAIKVANTREDARDATAAEDEVVRKAQFKRLVLFIIVIGTVIGISCTVALIGFGVLLKERDNDTQQLKDQAVTIQKQRYEAAFNTCELRNEQNVGIRKVLRQSKAPQSVINTFPETPCALYARLTVQGMDTSRKVIKAYVEKGVVK